MNRDIAEYIDLLTRRHEALEALASEMAAGQRACISLQLDAVRNHDANKAERCGEVRRLDAAIAKLQERTAGGHLAPMIEAGEGRPSAAIDNETVDHIWRLQRESEAAHAEIGRRNQVYAEFLRRAASTVDVMMNVMSHCLGAYPATLKGSAGLPPTGGL